MSATGKLTLFWMSFLVVGAILALFFGIGWLFLLLTLRRAVILVPPLENQLRQRLLGLPPKPSLADARIQRVTQVLGIITLLAWIGVTALAFIQLNTPLIRFFAGNP